jgi:hypothetical protein
VIQSEPLDLDRTDEKEREEADLRIGFRWDFSGEVQPDDKRRRRSRATLGWRTGGRGAEDLSELDCMVGDLNRFLLHGGGADGVGAGAVWFGRVSMRGFAVS